MEESTNKFFSGFIAGVTMAVSFGVWQRSFSAGVFVFFAGFLYWLWNVEPK